MLRVRACGICGSDLGYVRAGGVGGPTAEPLPLGHELSAEVVALGDAVEGLAIGARVVVHPGLVGNRIGNGGAEGAFAPLLLLRGARPGVNLFELPAGLADDQAALIEPLGVGMNAVDQVEAVPGDRVVVFGAGPIGLAAVAALADRGVDDVVAVDLSPTRLEIARKLGARATVDASEGPPWRALRELHGTAELMGAPMNGSDAYIEASGAPGVIEGILQRAKRGARLSVVALHYAPIPVSFLVVLMKELTIRGAMEYPADWSRMLDLVARRDLTPMITHRFPLERFPEALATAQDASVAGKVLIEMGT